MSAAIDNSDLESRLAAVVSSHAEAIAFKSRDAAAAYRSVMKINPEEEADNLTHGILAGPNAISVPPYVFTDNVSGSLLAFYHLGSRLSGHSGIVHGGISAVLLDECMGRACFPRLEHQIAVTARFEVEYKKPIPVDSIVYIMAETVDVQGRKATVKATVRDAATDAELVKAEGLFVEPKWASIMPKRM